MEIIIIEDNVYSVSAKELKEIQKQERAYNDAYAKNNDSSHLEIQLGEYLEKNKSKYKHIGLIQFQYRY